MTLESINKFKTRIYKGSHDMTMIQCTHNGSQWQSINLTKLRDIRLLWQDLSRYLGDLEYNNLRNMDDKKLDSLLKSVQDELFHRVEKSKV